MSNLAFDGTRLPTGEDKTRIVHEMFDRVAPRYDRVNRIVSMGLDMSWRRAAVASLALAPGSAVLDVASGTGDLAELLAHAGHRVVATDLSGGMLRANARAAARVQADVAALPLPDGSVDGLTCGYALRNFTDLDASVAEMARVVRPGGRLAVLEISEPSGRLMRTGFDLWFRRIVPVIGGLLSDREAYRYLPRSTAYLPPEPDLRRCFLDAGWSAVNIRQLSGGLSQLITATRGVPR